MWAFLLGYPFICQGRRKDKPVSFFINPKAREAFEEVLLPQMKDMVCTRMQAMQVELVLGPLLDEATTSKNSLYNTLIGYKPLQLNDEAYFADLKTAISQWAKTYK